MEEIKNYLKFNEDKSKNVKEKKPESPKRSEVQETHKSGGN